MTITQTNRHTLNHDVNVLDHTFTTAFQPIRVSAPSKKRLWTGRIMSWLPMALLLISSVMSILMPPQVREGMAHMGYPEDAAPVIGMLAIACAITYLVPRTSLLGAVLLTGYLGGAVASHIRIGEAFFAPVVFGMLVWGGLFLRDDRLRLLLAGQEIVKKKLNRVDLAVVHSTLQ